MINKRGFVAVRHLDLMIVLKKSLKHEQNRYFVLINGRGRSLDIEDLLKLRNQINKELYRVGRLQDPQAAVRNWQKQNPDRVKANAKAYHATPNGKAAAKRYKNKIKQLAEAKARAAEMANNPDARILIGHEVPEAETKEPLPAFVTN